MALTLPMTADLDYWKLSWLSLTKIIKFVQANESTEMRLPKVAFSTGWSPANSLKESRRG
jgi:hypothetical protein